jgi:membrane protease YdiL (CAAX protease family)
MTPDIFPLAMLCLSVAAIGNLFSGREVGAHPSRPASNRALLFFTGAGILLGFGFVIIPLSSAFRLILTPLKLPWLTIVGLDSVLTKTIVLVALPAFVLYGERRPLSSIGIRKPRRSDFAYGVGAFVVGELAVYSEAWIFSPSHFTGGEGQRALFLRLPLWLMILEAIVNGIAEEMTARGFAVERLSELTHNTVVGAALALIVNLLAHIPYWGIRETIVLAPAQVVLLILYLWRRSLAPCAIGHILVDLFPRLVAVVPALVPLYLTPYLSYDRQGSIYYTRGDFDRSIELFNRAIARDPRDSYAYQWRGLAYLNKKDYPKSLSDLADAIRIDPNRGSPYAHRAFVYSTKSDH